MGAVRKVQFQGMPNCVGADHDMLVRRAEQRPTIMRARSPRIAGVKRKSSLSGLVSLVCLRPGDVFARRPRPYAAIWV